MSNVLVLPVVTRLDIPVERVLDMAGVADLKSVLVLGYTQKGVTYFASSMASGPECVWLMEALKRDLLEYQK